MSTTTQAPAPRACSPGGFPLQIEPRHLRRRQRDLDCAKAAVKLRRGRRPDQRPHRERLMQDPGESDVDLLAALRGRELCGAALAFEVLARVPAADELGIGESVDGGTWCEEAPCLTRPCDEGELVLR